METKPSRTQDFSLPDETPAELPPKSDRSVKKSRWPLALGGLLLLAIGGGGWWLMVDPSRNSPNAASQAQSPPATPVKLASVTVAPVEDSTPVLGSLQAQRTVQLKPQVDGRIVSLRVKDGDRVRQGQVIATLDSADLQAELQQARAQLTRATARLAELEAGSRTEDLAEARAKVQEAEVRLQNAKVGDRPEEIAQAQAQIASAEADAKLASQREERYARIRDEGAISADQYQEYATDRDRAIAALEQAKRRLSQLQNGRRSDVSALTAAVEQARQNLQRLENGPRPQEIAQARADVADASANVQIVKSKLAKTQITAPINGIVGDIPVKLGDYLQKGDTLTEITENNQLELNLSIPLEQASKLRIGLPVAILDAGDRTLAKGRLSFISPNVTGDSQMVLAKAAFDNAQSQLLNQQFIPAKVIWSTRPGILVPSAAISRVGGQNFVFVAKPASAAPKAADPSAAAPKTTRPPNANAQSPASGWVVEQRQVTLGAMQGNNYHVLKGLKAGEKIVTAGILQLRDGAPVSPLPAGSDRPAP